ncbi:MAG: hypothetical protein RMH84_06265 [Sulfolobales archaeon]|nr:hypothetical protein [Sulfolobales archaeon]
MSYLVGNLALGLALLSLLIKKKSRGWKPIRSSRKYLNALKADAR